MGGGGRRWGNHDCTLVHCPPLPSLASLDTLTARLSYFPCTPASHKHKKWKYTHHTTPLLSQLSKSSKNQNISWKILFPPNRLKGGIISCCFYPGFRLLSEEDWRETETTRRLDTIRLTTTLHSLSLLRPQELADYGAVPELGPDRSRQRTT